MSPAETETVACRHPGGEHRIACRVHGRRGASAVLCVHGLSRNAQDFDALADRLVAAHFVVAVDMPGRGESERMADPRLYADDTYLGDLERMIAADRERWAPVVKASGFKAED